MKIETKRLNMVPVSDQYMSDIIREFTPEITKYMPYIPTGELVETQQFLDKAKLGLLNGTDIVLAVLDVESLEFLGCCGIHDISEESMELGLWLKAGRHGQGLGTEIIEGLISFIEKNLKFNYLIYPVDKDNLASRKIPEKLGFSVFSEYTKPKAETGFLNIIEYRKYALKPGL